MLEHEFMCGCRLWLTEQGFKVFRANVGNVRMSDGRYFNTGLPKGFSDMFAVKNGRAYFFETKVKPNKPTKEQLNFIDVMRKQGCTAGVIYSLQELEKLINDC
jgi:ribosomal protein L16/L10AE